MNTLNTKRIYDPVSETDGFRVLVDRLWPRGISKEKARVDLWAKGVTPSTVLRKEFHQKPDQFDEFRSQYDEELRRNAETERFIARVRLKLKEGNVTFLYAAKDREAHHAQILKELVENEDVKR